MFKDLPAELPGPRREVTRNTVSVWALLRKRSHCDKKAAGSENSCHRLFGGRVKSCRGWTGGMDGFVPAELLLEQCAQQWSVIKEHNKMNPGCRL